eukprot:4054534-Amphidinium_carterae.1
MSCRLLVMSLHWLRCLVPRLCYDFDMITTYLNQPNVQQELGASAERIESVEKVNQNFEKSPLRLGV